MEYFTNRYPDDITQSAFYRYGYHDANLKFVKLAEPLVLKLTDRYPGVFGNDELDPNQYLFLSASLVFEYLFNLPDDQTDISKYIQSIRSSGFLDCLKKEHQIFSNQFEEIHQSFTMMASDLQKTQSENEIYEKRVAELEEKIKDFTRLISVLQNELDGVSNSGQKSS